MKPESIPASMAMLKDVVAGKSYGAVAAEHGISRTAVERRIKYCVLELDREVGVEAMNEEGIVFVQRLRLQRDAIAAALERYALRASRKKPTTRILTDDDIAFVVRRARTRSTCPHRDVALIYVLLCTGARPLEIARLQVSDYLMEDGGIREASILRADVAINGKARPLYFANAKVQAAVDRYLLERSHHRESQTTTGLASFRGLSPDSRLFLTESCAPFKIVRNVKSGQTHFLCRGILDAYRKIFRYTGIEGLSALEVRRSVAARMFMHGATEEQIGEVLGISGLKTVRKMLPTVRHTLQKVMQELV